MKQKFILLSAIAALAFTSAQAQVGIGTASPNASSVLEVLSTTKGVLISRMTAAQRTAIASPAQGLMVYQTTAPEGLWAYIGGQWLRLASTADVSASSQASGFAANTSGSVIAVVLGGTNVPLPNDQNFSGITADGTNTTFTVSAAGRYRVSYNVNLTAALLVSSRILLNGSPVTSATVSPSISASNLHAETILTLSAGDTITLQLFGLLGVATLTASSQGAALAIEQL